MPDSNRPRFDFILFDHDETLLSTFEARVVALEAATREVTGRSVDAAAYFDASQGNSLDQMSDDLTGGDAALTATLIETYREHYYRSNLTGLRVFDGIAQTLQTLAAHSIGLGVVTSKLASGAREELQSCGLVAHFGCIVGAENVTRPKPDAEPLERAMALLGADPARTLMVGDTAADILGARAAGLPGAVALWGSREADALRSLEPDYLLRHPAELIALTFS